MNRMTDGQADKQTDRQTDEDGGHKRLRVTTKIL